MSTIVLKIHWILPFLFLLHPSLAPAEVYRYIDQEGVISFTNDPELVPDAFRDTVEVIQDEDLPKLGTRSIENIPSASKTTSFLDRSTTPYLVGFFLITLFMVLVLKLGGANTMIKTVFTFLFISLIGATIYSLIFTQSRTSKITTGAKSMVKELKKASPIHRAKESVQNMNNQQEKQQDMINLLHSSENQ